MGQRVLNNPRNVLQFRILANLTNNLVLRDTNDGLGHHLVVTLGAFGCVNDALVHLFVGFVGFLELSQVVIVQSELFLGRATITVFVMFVLHFIYLPHWSCIVNLLLPCEVENRLSIFV